MKVLQNYLVPLICLHVSSLTPVDKCPQVWVEFKAAKQQFQTGRALSHPHGPESIHKVLKVEEGKVEEEKFAPSKASSETPKRLQPPAHSLAQANSCQASNLHSCEVFTAVLKHHPLRHSSRQDSDARKASPGQEPRPLSPLPTCAGN